MKKTTAAILALTIILTLVNVNLTPVMATATSPYCRISYNSSIGCNVIDYYYYKKGSTTAKRSPNRLVKFYDTKILLGPNNTVVTNSHKAGTNPAWTVNGAYLVWIEVDNTTWARNFKNGQNIQLTQKETRELNLNAETMVESLSFYDNSSQKIAELLPSQPNTPSTPKPSNPSKPVIPTKPTPSKPATPTKTYAEPTPNKWTLYRKGSSKKYVLSRESGNLYLEGILVATGIKKSDWGFGFAKSGKEFFYQKGSFVYVAKVSKPLASSLYKQNVSALVFDKKTFLITKTKSLTSKKDFVFNTKNKSIWYHSNKQKAVLQVKGRDILLNGKIIKTLSKKQTVKKVGFTEKAQIFYQINGKKYVAPVNRPTKISLIKKTVARDSLGFIKLK